MTEIANDIAVDQNEATAADMTEAVVEDQDALNMMLGYLEEEVEEEVAEEVVEEEVEADVEPGLEEEEEEEVVEETEAVVEEVPKSNLPEYLADVKINEDGTVTVGEDTVNKDLLLDAVNAREKRAKAEWTKKPVSKMNDDEKLAYKAVQRASDRSKAQTAAVETQTESEKLYSHEQWTQYNKLVEKPELKNLFGAIDDVIGVPQKNESVPEPEAEKAKAAAILAEKLSTGIEEGMDKEEIGVLLENFESEIESKLESKVDRLVDDKINAHQTARESKTQNDALVAEHNRLMEDDRYKAISSQIGEDGANPIIRLFVNGDHMGNRYPSLESAFDYLMNAQTYDGDAYSFELDAIPSPSTVQVVEDDLTQAEMEDKSDADVMLALLRKSGF